MPECHYCENLEPFMFKCKFCKKSFCSEHRLPENHECKELERGIWGEYKEFRGKIGNFNRIEEKFLMNFADILPKRACTTLLAIILFLSILAFIFGDLFRLFALMPGVLLKEPWRIITSMFIHVGPFHLFVNSFVLFMFGSELENRVGYKEFLKIFFFSGISAALGHSLFSIAMGSLNPAVGASGAIYGILGTLIMIAPEIRVIIFPILIPMKLSTAILIFIIWDLFLRSWGVPIANIAHLAGLIFGLSYGKKLRLERIQTRVFV